MFWETVINSFSLSPLNLSGTSIHTAKMGTHRRRGEEMTMSPVWGTIKLTGECSVGMVAIWACQASPLNETDTAAAGELQHTPGDPWPNGSKWTSMWPHHYQSSPKQRRDRCWAKQTPLLLPVTPQNVTLFTTGKSNRWVERSINNFQKKYEI